MASDTVPTVATDKDASVTTSVAEATEISNVTKGVKEKAETITVNPKSDVANGVATETTKTAIPITTQLSTAEAIPEAVSIDPSKANSSKATKTAPRTAPKAKTAPPGYKLVKVKNADGKIIVVKKRLSPDELAAAAKKGEDAKPDNTASEQTKSVEYKIVSIPQPDGTLVKVRRAIHPEDAVVGKQKTADKAPDAKAGPVQKEDAVLDEGARRELIKEQKHKFRMGRSRKYRRTLLRGFAMQLIGELPDIELDSHGFQDGDQVISDDDSDLDFDSDDDDVLFKDNDDPNSESQDSPVNINTKSIAKNVYNAATGQANKKKPSPVANPAIQPSPSPAGDKVTYNVTEKDLEKVDDEKPSSQLQRHWERFSFYFMASLSIILPLLFVLLSIGATLMDRKSTGSHWNAVDRALKFAVSAWPIVFAAVVAQCFKTYATYKVERGIKLMQLEQLVGSNSFASAIKQPIMLRRLDVYTLVIFVAWCLSPIGSQAIVRVATTEWTEHCQNTTVWFLSRNGINPVFDTAADYYNDGNDIGTHTQQAAMAFGTTFDPDAGLGGVKTQYYQDSWGNPQTFMGDEDDEDDDVLSSVFGTPYFLTDSMFFAETYASYYGNSSLTEPLYDGPGASANRFESFSFPMESSYFSLDCGAWTVLNSREMADKIAAYELLPSLADTPTYYMSYGWADSELDEFGLGPANKSFDMLRWGSFNWLSEDNTNGSAGTFISINETSLFSAPAANGTAEYSYIECPITQNFVAYNLSCSIVQNDYLNGAAYQCMYASNTTAVNNTRNHTDYYDFTSDFLAAVEPTAYTGSTTITPFERYLASGGLKFDSLFTFTDERPRPSDVNSSYAFWYDMSNNTTPAFFGLTFAFAFNSWLDTGYCPGLCRTTYPHRLLELALLEGYSLEVEEHLANGSALLETDLLIPAAMFEPANGTWCYAEDLVFTVRKPYLALLYICSVTLLLLGVASVVVESRVVAPDVLGYASTVARNSRYLHLPATAPGMSGADRVRRFGGTVVMMQDVKKGASVGKIALGNKKDDSERLRTDRHYR